VLLTLAHGLTVRHVEAPDFTGPLEVD